MKKIGDDIYDLARGVTHPDDIRAVKERLDIPGNLPWPKEKELSCRQEVYHCTKKGREELSRLVKSSSMERLRELEAEALMSAADEINIVSDFYDISELGEVRECLFDRPGTDCRRAMQDLVRACAGVSEYHHDAGLGCLDEQTEGGLDVILLSDLVERVSAVQAEMKERGWFPEKWTLGDLEFIP